MYRIYNIIIWLVNFFKLIVNIRLWRITSWFLPEEKEFVLFVANGYIQQGMFEKGVFVNYPAKYKPTEVKRWCPAELNLWSYVDKPKQRKEFNPYIWLPYEKTIKYRDGNFVSRKTAKALERNPFHTTLSDKGKTIEQNTEKAKQKRLETKRKVTGRIGEL